MESTELNPIRDIYSRVIAVLKGERPDRLPFIDRLELWYTAHTRAGTLPDAFQGMTLTQVHRAVGFGQQRMISLYKAKLHGVEVISSWEGEEYFHETAPVLEDFPRLYSIVQPEKPGVTITEFLTPVGKLTIRHQLLPSMIASGTVAYKIEHYFKDESDYHVLEYILERAEFVPEFGRFQEEQGRIGKIGFVLPMLPRIPFQQILIDYIGEVPTFYLLFDNPQIVDNLMALVDEKLVDVLRKLSEFAWPLVEFADNLEAGMTNPKLFRTHCLPYYQRYADILHGQGKKMGSHTDGNIKPLLGLLAESGLDICESFSPYPLTQCTFETAWNAWHGHPLIWGGIPSPILEARTSEADFKAYVDQVLQTVGDQPIILGVGDMVLGNNMIERVQYIADRVEELC